MTSAAEEAFASAARAAADALALPAVGWELARARSGDLALLRACFRGERAEPVLPVL